MDKRCASPVPGKPVSYSGPEPPVNQVNNHEKEFTLRDFFRLLGNRKTTVLGCTVLMTVFLTFVALAGSPVYEADGMFQITGQGGTLGILSDLLPGGGSGSLIKSEIEIVRSRSVSLSVIDDLDLRIRIDDVTYGNPFSKAVMFVLADRIQRKLREIRLDAVEFPPDSIGKHFILVYTDDAGSFRLTGPGGEIGTGHEGEAFISDSISFTVTTMKGSAGSKFEIAPREIGEALRSYREDLSVSSVAGSTGTNLIRVQYRDSNPGLASEVVNGIIDEYERRNTEWKSGLGASQTDLIEARLTEVQSELRDSEDALAAYKNEFGVVILPEEATRAVANLSQREAQRTDVNLRISLLQDIHTRLAGGLENDSFAVPPSLTGDPVIQQLAADHARLTVELNDLLLDYTESHPTVIAKRESLLGIRESILAAISSTIQGLIEQRIDLDGVVGGLENDLYSIPGVERNLLELTRRRDVSDDSYRLLATRLDEARLVSASYQVGNRIIDRAIPPDRIIAPSIKKNLAIGFGLGLLLGIFLAFLVEISDVKLRRPDQVGDFLNGNPVIIIRHGDDAEISRTAGTIALSTVQSVRKSLALLAPGRLHGNVQEIIERAITELSRGVQPVFVVDATTHTDIAIFGVDPSKGMMEIADGTAVDPQPVENGRILVLPPGDNPSSVIVTSPPVRDVISKHANRAGLTLFLLSDFANDPGLRGWLQMTDGVVLVLQRNRDLQNDIITSVEALNANGIPVLAALFIE